MVEKAVHQHAPREDLPAFRRKQEFLASGTLQTHLLLNKPGFTVASCAPVSKSCLLTVNTRVTSYLLPVCVSSVTCFMPSYL